MMAFKTICPSSPAARKSGSFVNLWVFYVLWDSGFMEIDSIMWWYVCTTNNVVSPSCLSLCSSMSYAWSVFEIGEEEGDGFCASIVLE